MRPKWKKILNKFNLERQRAYAYPIPPFGGSGEMFSPRPVLPLKRACVKGAYFFNKKNGYAPRAYSSNLATLPYNSGRVSSYQRIGPHNFDILSILIGSLLGDGSMEKSKDGYRFVFYQKGDHIEYLVWLHANTFKLGYCKENIPQIQSRLSLGAGSSLVYYCRFRTFTFSSFYWIYEGFYSKGKKVLPGWIEQYLSPIALAIWIMDDGTWIKNRGIRLCTNNFTLSEVKKLAGLLTTKYKLKVSIHKTGIINQYGIYIPKSNLPLLITIVSPHMHPYFKYKLNYME